MTDKWFRMDDPENPPPKDGSLAIFHYQYDRLDIPSRYEMAYWGRSIVGKMEFLTWDGCTVCVGGDEEEPPTHWMPMPEPPK